MKPKTARRRLMRNRFKIAQAKTLGEKKLKKRLTKPYLKALRKDLENPASLKVYRRFQTL